MSEWVSVEDELPAKGVAVIAVGYMPIGVAFPAMLSDRGWLDMEEVTSDGHYMTAGEVTLWQPLPPPPK